MRPVAVVRSKRRERWLVRWLAAGIVAAAALVGGGCRRPQARTVPEMPALDVPPPPPRDPELVEVQTPPLIPLIEAPARIVPERPRVSAPARDTAKTDPPKPEAPPSGPKPLDDARPAGTLLQTTPAGREDEIERRIRAVLATAVADLGRIDARRLDPDMQVQYDTAKGFVRQAEDALKARNLVFAETNANKAAVLAGQLTGR